MSFCGFGGVEPWNGQLFHVEQFEKGRNNVVFRGFWTGKAMDCDGPRYGGDGASYGEFHRGR